MIEVQRSPHDSGAKEHTKEIPPVVVEWGTPFRLNTVALDLKDDRHGKGSVFGGYYHMYVPIIFGDGTAKGNIRFVRKDPSWRDGGVLITGERVLDVKGAKQFASTQVSLWLDEPIGLQDAHLTVRRPDGSEVFTTQRTSACGAIPKAQSDNTFLYFSHGRLGESGLADPQMNLGLDILYIPLSGDGSRLDQDLLFSFDRFPVDGRYYGKFPMLRNVLKSQHKSTIHTS